MCVGMERVTFVTPSLCHVALLSSLFMCIVALWVVFQVEILEETLLQVYFNVM